MEEVVVTADTPRYLRSFRELHLQQEVDTSQQPPAQNLAELVLHSPDAALNGQGGMLQMYSIRGISRWRVQTLLENVPIITDRRAGSAASFVPPAFIGQLQLIPGASSSTFGSGALGGSVSLRLQNTKGFRGVISSDTNQNSENLSFTSSTGTSDAGFSYRQAERGTDANGDRLNDGFEHLAGFLRQRKSSGLIRDAWLLVSEGNDWGKSSSRFPDNRITFYPKNRHIVFGTQFQVGDVLIEPHVHDAHLQTHIARSDSLTVSENNALNYGINANGQDWLSDWQVFWRIGLRARDNVNAKEQVLDNQASLLRSQTTLAGDEREYFAHADVFRPFKHMKWVNGLRVSHTHMQDSNSANHRSDDNVSGYSGLLWKINSQWVTSAHLGTAYRTPALTELFFNGITPRGQVSGDTNLTSESALNIEHNLGYKSRDFEMNLAAFYQEIDNYIERITVDEEVLRYQNLERATIQGISYRLNSAIAQEKFSIGLSGQWLSGKDENDSPLIDVSPHHHNLSLLYELSVAQLRMDIRHRMSKNDVASGEQPLPELTTVSLSISGQLHQQWRYRIAISNATNELARTSTDEDAPYMRGRQAVVELQFSI